jgi:hypothetical protein
MPRRKTEETGRVNLLMPESLMSELVKVAEEHNTTVSDAFRKSIKLMLSAEKARKKGGGVFLQQDSESKPHKIDIFGL